jgi:hypothetical protein
MSANAQDCQPCLDYYRDRPHLTGACASVGIEHGLSTEQVVASVLRDFHRRGHPAYLGAGLKQRQS